MTHLRNKHGVTKEGRKVPRVYLLKDKAVNKVTKATTRRKKEGVVKLTTTVRLEPFKNALIA